MVRMNLNWIDNKSMMLNDKIFVGIIWCLLYTHHHHRYHRIFRHHGDGCILSFQKRIVRLLLFQYQWRRDMVLCDIRIIYTKEFFFFNILYAISNKICSTILALKPMDVECFIVMVFTHCFRFTYLIEIQFHFQ